MNCLEFESQVEILARGALADARTRAAAEAHKEACAACAARLADERSLSVGLRALAAGMKTAEAPPRVEAALVAAFRARAAAAAVAEGSGEVAAASNVVPMSGHAPARRLSWAKTVAVASLAAAASLALFVLVSPEAPRKAAPQKAMIVEPPSNSNGVPPAPTVAHNASTNGLGNVAPSPDEVTDDAPRPAFVPRPRAVNASLTSRGGGRLRPSPAEAGRPQEVATEFIPLGQGAPYTQVEEGHIVRVELPRSALVSFGLPVNAEAPQGRVKADVLLGHDGVARAIRFVR
jgi:hypothetical protein